MSYGISQKNAIKEFQLKEDVLENAMKDGKLKFHWKSCHGNSYRSLIYRDVVEFAKVAEKDPVLVEQDEKRKQESRPYQKPKTKPTPPLVELHLSELNIIRCLYFYEF